MPHPFAQVVRGRILITRSREEGAPGGEAAFMISHEDTKMLRRAALHLRVFV